MSTVPPPSPDEQSGIQRATQKLRLPMVSGRGSVLALLLCFLASAGFLMTLGTVMHLPIWIEFELMLLAWWLVWIAALSHFLYHGKRVSDDHVMQPPRNWFASAPKKDNTPKDTTQKDTTKASTSSGGRPWGWDFGGFGGADEGCLWVFAILAAVILLFLVAWLLIEVLIPVLTVILYGLIRGMLARIANQGHGCKGHFGPALFWGTVWATVYTAPLALMVWVVHLIVAYNAARAG